MVAVSRGGLGGLTRSRLWNIFLAALPLMQAERFRMWDGGKCGLFSNPAHLEACSSGDEPNRTMEVTGMKIDKEAEISEAWRKESVCIYSSAKLGWTGIVLEYHLAQPGEKPLTSTQYHIVELAVGQEPSYGERPNRRGAFLPYSKYPGGINIYAEGVLPPIYPSTQTELIVCALKPDFVAEIAEEQGAIGTAELPEGIGLRDEGTAGLIRLLDEEARTGGRLGRLYAEHLIHALSQRLLLMGTAKEANASLAALPRPRLKRVLDRMQADLSTDLDLHSLAKESGYSKSHFLRMFREATGITPYQYLLRLRLQQAQRMIKEKSSGLVDIAFACGFSSHTHMSRMFRQAIGITPSEYRRGIS
jgi:AraC family transcriptional regulator